MTAYHSNFESCTLLIGVNSYTGDGAGDLHATCLYLLLCYDQCVLFVLDFVFQLQLHIALGLHQALDHSLLHVHRLRRDDLPTYVDELVQDCLELRLHDPTGYCYIAQQLSLSFDSLHVALRVAFDLHY